MNIKEKCILKMLSGSTRKRIPYKVKAGILYMKSAHRVQKYSSLTSNYGSLSFFLAG